ncbi:MAG TPA: EAL domain-containing protein, partial [Nitrosospira sp.]|nr:EAL domain-containing protein [Nitrosospira sp.]
DQLRHEANVLCKDASVRHILWLHSRLTRHTAEDPAILSVGLDMTEHKRAEGRLAWLADHDPLTDLFNRRRFQEELEQMLNLAARYKHSGALLFFDLDQFKYINDTSGHQAGDALLKMVARMLLGSIRSVDILGRLGGDEFAVILPQTTAEGAIEVAKNALASLSKGQITVNGRTHKALASIGIALFPEHGNNVHDLLAAADLAMYQAKEAGRAGWHLFSDEEKTRERMHTLVYWKEKIEHALLHERFLFYFQPIMHIPDKSINHYEVLLRMLDDDGTVLAPNLFIPAAEQTGLIHAIDHMVLTKAIAQSAQIQHNGQRVHFSINLSAHAFRDPELLPTLTKAFDRYSADPTNFMFEITETAALEDLDAAKELMETIKALGCSFTLDDFGVGFSSFYYIRQLPVDIVKIDGSFIRNLAENPDDQILVKALCDVARGFGKKTTAEFIETSATLSILESMNVDYAQGFLIGTPVSAEESPFRDYLKPRNPACPSPIFDPPRQF